MGGQRARLSGKSLHPTVSETGKSAVSSCHPRTTNTRDRWKHYDYVPNGNIICSKTSIVGDHRKSRNRIGELKRNQPKQARQKQQEHKSQQKQSQKNPLAGQDRRSSNEHPINNKEKKQIMGSQKVQEKTRISIHWWLFFFWKRPNINAQPCNEIICLRNRHHPQHDCHQLHQRKQSQQQQQQQQKNHNQHQHQQQQQQHNIKPYTAYQQPQQLQQQSKQRLQQTAQEPLKHNMNPQHKTQHQQQPSQHIIQHKVPQHKKQQPQQQLQKRRLDLQKQLGLGQQTDKHSKRHSQQLQSQHTKQPSNKHKHFQGQRQQQQQDQMPQLRQRQRKHQDQHITNSSNKQHKQHQQPHHLGHNKDESQQSPQQQPQQQQPPLQKDPTKTRRLLATIHINIFLYSCSYWMQSALFPYLSKQMGADSLTFGYLQTTFDFLQLGGGLVFSRVQDLFGSRVVMTLAFAGSASSYLSLYFATSVPGLFLSRIPSMLMHAYQGSQVMVSAATSAGGKTDALAKLGVSFELGVVTGRLVGGWIATVFSLKTAALVSFVASMVSVVVVQTTIPPKVTDAKVSKENDQTSLFRMGKFYDILSAPGVLFLMVVKIGLDLPLCVFQSMFSIIALETFQLPVDVNCYILSYFGLLSMLVQGLGVSYVTKRFSHLSILAMSALVMTISYVTLSMVTSIGQLCLVFLPLTTGVTLHRVIMTSALTDTVAAHDTGAMLGLSKSFLALTRTVTPTVGGYMMENLGFPSFGRLGFITCAVITVALVVKHRRESNP